MAHSSAAAPSQGCQREGTTSTISNYWPTNCSLLQNMMTGGLCNNGGRGLLPASAPPRPQVGDHREEGVHSPPSTGHPSQGRGHHAWVTSGNALFCLVPKAWTRTPGDPASRLDTDLSIHSRQPGLQGATGRSVARQNCLSPGPPWPLWSGKGHPGIVL